MIWWLGEFRCLWVSAAVLRVVSPNTLMPTAYCVKEKKTVEIKDPKEVVLKNGRRALQGVCPNCGTKVTRILGKLSPVPAFGQSTVSTSAAPTPAAAPAPAPEPAAAPAQATTEQPAPQKPVTQSSKDSMEQHTIP